MKEVKDGFRFLRGDTMIHPTTGITLEYLIKQDAVCVAVFDNSLKYVYLVEQYRPGANKNLIEVVAGLIDEGEDPDTAVIREFNEETGFRKSDIENIIQMENFQYVSPGYTTEKLYYYAIKLKKDAIPHEQHLDLGEDVTLKKMTVEEALNKSIDTKTTFSILYFKEVLK